MMPPIVEYGIVKIVTRVRASTILFKRSLYSVRLISILWEKIYVDMSMFSLALSKLYCISYKRLPRKRTLLRHEYVSTFSCFLSFCIA